MPVGQIQRNYIQQNSVGVGFYGYSGWSGWSGWSGPPGGFTGISAGKYAWVMDVLVFDSLNGYYVYNLVRAQYSCWSVYPICNMNTQVPPGTFWVDGDSTIPGFTTKVRVRAVVGTTYANSGDLLSFRLRKVSAFSRDYPWPGEMASYADNNLLVTDDRRYTFWGPVVPNSEVSVYFSGRDRGDSGAYDFQPSHLVGPWCSASDGFYMVECWDWYTGAYPAYGIVLDKVFLEFAKVKD